MRWILLAGSVILSACTPMGALPGLDQGQGTAGSASQTSQVAPLTASEQQKLREQRAELSGAHVPDVPSAGLSADGSRVYPIRNDGPGEASDSLPPLPPLKQTYRYAMPVPGRPGWVYNPYTNSSVDVRGVESGKLVYDETDPANRNPDASLKPVSEMPHKFYVP